MSCGNFFSPPASSHLLWYMFPPYLPVPTCCGTCFLPTCQFPPAVVHVSSLPASSGLGSPIAALEVPFRPWKSHSGLGSPIPALEVPFRPWKSHSGLEKSHSGLEKSHSGLKKSHSGLKKSHSGLGSPIPALEVPCHVVNSSPLDVPSPAVNSSSHLPICQFPSWMSHLLW